MWNVIFWMMPVVAQAAPILEVDGSCPGAMSVDITDSTPSGQVAILTGAGLGTTEVPAGPCTTALLDIEGSVALRGRVTADALGGYGLTPTVSAGACGLAVQALDLTTCEVSRVVYTPESTAEYVATEAPLTDYDVDGGYYRLSLSDDAVSDVIDLGFSFNYYGETYDTVQVISNGGLSFGSGHTDTHCCSGETMPTSGAYAGTDPMHLAGWWSDLNPSATGGGFISYDYGEDAITGERFMMVDFYAVQPYGGSGSAAEESYFQMVVFEGGSIELRVLRGYIDGSAYTVGYQSPDASEGETLFFASTGFLESTTYRIEPR